MKYLTQKELKEMFLKSWQRVEEKKEEINKINVFPVPDMDTGSNLAKTLLGVKEAIEKKEFKDLSEISEAALDGALTTAQGNAGVIYTGFLAGFLPLLDKNPVDAKRLALAFEEGQKRAWKSMFNPKEGTILDVIDAAAQTFIEESKKEADIIKILKKAIEKAKEALMNTREKLEILKKANVVDAGGLGFLMILESYLEALEPTFTKFSAGKEKPSEKISKFIQVLSNRYEIVSLIENLKVDEKEIGEKLKKLGNSLDIVQVGKKMKIHIHTDYPEEVKNMIRNFGQIQDLREEDMTKEVIGEPSVRKVSIGIVTENVTMLLPKIIERYQIEIAEAKYDWPEEKNIPGDNIYQKMRVVEKYGIKTTPKTTQATPKQYLDAFKKQLQRPSTRAELGAGPVPHRNKVSGAGFDKVLCITISSKISGCYNSAVQAREMLSDEEKERIFILDSENAAAGEALLVLKAIELIQEQREIGEIIDELKNLIPKTHLYLMFEDPKWIESIGRITSSQANWIRRMKKLRLHPIMEFKEGVIGKGGIIFAKDMAEALFKKMEKESKKERRERKIITLRQAQGDAERSRSIRVIIGHADNLEQAEILKKLLKEKIKAEVLYIDLGPTIICAGVGPGTLILGWQPV